MVRTSETIGELSEALVKAQGKFSSAIKDSTNPAFRSKYADLTSVIAAMVPHLNSEGLAIMQHPSLEYKADGETSMAFVTVTTRLQHKSGQFMESDLSIPAVMRDRFDAQSVGSAITYCCRYGLQSIGVLGREDDDAQSAVGSGSTAAAQAVGQKKLSELKEKVPERIFDGSLLYTWYDASQTAQITGPAHVMKANEDLLKPLKLGDKLIANGEQLDALKYELENRGVSFKCFKTVKAVGA